jgi:hypothetical protein
LDPRAWTIRSAPGRMGSLEADPCLAVLTDEPDLLAALERLSR